MTCKNEERYQVECANCGYVFTPAYKSPFWWQAKQRADYGYLDASRVLNCGCVQPQSKPDAPFRVFGYTDMCESFDIPFDTFVAAVKELRQLRKSGAVASMNGISIAVLWKICY